MKNLPILFCGIFFTLAFSWVGIVLSNQLDFAQNFRPTTSERVNPTTGDVIPAGGVFDEETGKFLAATDGVNQEGETIYPQTLVGAAERGKHVYMSLGCLYCHSQQVRRKGFGSDYERGWGDRQTVPRDYIRQERVLLGTMRTGPDLANVGIRYTPDWHYLHLYNPQITSEGSNMPPFRFLFEKREIGPAGPSAEALSLTGEYAVEEGYEVIPTKRAEDLVAYLMNLQVDYDLPEIKRIEE